MDYQRLLQGILDIGEAMLMSTSEQMTVYIEYVRVMVL